MSVKEELIREVLRRIERLLEDHWNGTIGDKVVKEEIVSIIDSYFEAVEPLQKLERAENDR
ncbi:MAG: hypothetical protein DRJ46_04900 [Thermoprotei archaeon]|nr:MAG: hypothetical protein DRJ46_04900 [Thermoprotei archaeon]